MNETRERLIQLLQEAEGQAAYYDGDDAYGEAADYLLDNGVIVPLVTVGQTVWAIEFYRGKPIAIHGDMVQMVGFTSRSVKIALRNHHSFGKTFVLGKTVFLTREEAEEALKARENEKNH